MAGRGWGCNRTAQLIAYTCRGLLVDDLDPIEQRVIHAGLAPFGRERYDPGERFYFFDWDGIGFEIVSYG